MLDGKYYIGCHQTNDLDDGYLGSGKYLKRAIKKYGKSKFKRDVLHIFDNAEEMFKSETLIVNESVVKDPLSYNLKIGGSGGNPGIVGAFKGRKHSDETKRKQRVAMRSITLEHTEQMKDPVYQKEFCEKIRNGIKEKYPNGRTKTHLGKCWIYHQVSKINKMIQKTELEEYILNGWIKGRII